MLLGVGIVVEIGAHARLGCGHGGTPAKAARVSMNGGFRQPSHCRKYEGRRDFEEANRSLTPPSLLRHPLEIIAPINRTAKVPTAKVAAIKTDRSLGVLMR